MADHKIQLNFGASYTGQQVVKQVHKDIESGQGKVRQAGEVSKHVLSSLAGQLSGELSGSLRMATSLLEDFVRGGIWGVLGAVANAALSGVIYLWNQHKEAAKSCMEFIATRAVESVSALTGKYSEMHEAINRASAEAREMMAVLNGEIAAKAEMKVHKLHIETLQRLTDATSEAAKNAILAEEALAAAKIRQAALAEQSANNVAMAEQAIKEAGEKRVAAEAALAEITGKRVEYEGGATGWYAQMQERRRLIEMAEIEYANGVISAEVHVKKRTAHIKALAEMEQEYATQIRTHAEMIKAEKDASTAVEAAKRGEALALNSVTMAKQKEAAAALQMERTIIDSEQKIKNLAAAEEAAAKAEDERIKAKAIEMMTANASVKIQEICNKYNLETAEYVALYKQSLESGLTHVQAYHELQAKLNEELKKRADAEKKAAEGAAGSGVGGKDGKGSKGKPVYVSLSTSISDEIGKTGGKTWSETQKAARKQHNEMLKDALPLYRAMKGQMPKDQQKLFEQYMMSKYTPDQVKKIWDEAQSKQLIDKTERKRQTKYLEAMVKAMEKQGLK